MKKRERRLPLRRVRMMLLAALVLALALGLGLVLPSVTSAIQDYNTDRLYLDAGFSEGMLRLASDESKIERLSGFYSLISGSESDDIDFAVSASGGGFMTEQAALDKLETVFALVKGTSMEMGECRMVSYNVQSGRLLDSGRQTAIPLCWGVYMELETESGGSWRVEYVVDDSTGIILAARCTDTALYIGDGKALSGIGEDVRRIADNMAGIYGFTNTDLVVTEPRELSPVFNVCYIDLISDSGEAHYMPVSIGVTGWAINLDSLN